MKILYLTQSYFPSESSSSLSIVRMCKLFAKEGHRVTLMGLRSKRALSDPRNYYDIENDVVIKTHYYPKTLRIFGLRNRMYARAILSLIEESKPDLIYSRFCLETLNSLKVDLPVYYEMHSPGPITRSYLKKRLFERVLKSRKICRIISTTSMLKDYLHKNYPEIDVVVARLSSEPPLLIDQQRMLEFQQNNIRGKADFRVGYTGYLDTTGLRGTEIICKIAEAMPDIDFHVVGGPERNRKYWEKAAESDNIFFYGHRKPDDMPLFLRSFDLVLAPLQLITNKKHPLGMGLSPLKIPQYLAYGCAIVASDIPAHREILTHGINCLLSEPKDINSWCDAIRNLREDKNLINKIKSNAEVLYYNSYQPAMRIGKILSGSGTCSI